MTLQESEVMRRQQKRANKVVLEAMRSESTERTANAKLVEEDRQARVLSIVLFVCALVFIASVVA